MRKVFFDWEFDEDGVAIRPISLGMVSEDGRDTLYLEMQFDETLVNPWVREHVLPHLSWHPHSRLTREQARDHVIGFVGEGGPLVNKRDRKPDFEAWGYFADYDWVLLAQLFGPMVNLPANFPMFCMDLQQWWIQLGSPEGIKPKKPKDAHNALADARWNRDCWNSLDAYAKSLKTSVP